MCLSAGHYQYEACNCWLVLCDDDASFHQSLDSFFKVFVMEPKGVEHLEYIDRKLRISVSKSILLSLHFGIDFILSRRSALRFINLSGTPVPKTGCKLEGRWNTPFQ